jgi:hypothetical protein
MVERRRFGDLIPHLILLIGVAVVAFPVYLCFVGSTHEQSVIANGQMPITPGSLFWPTYYKTIFVGTTGTTREPVSQMLFNSFVMAPLLPSARSPSRSSRPTPWSTPLSLPHDGVLLIFMTLMLPVKCLSHLQDLGRPSHSLFLRRPDDPADRLGHCDAVLPPVLHDHPRRADRGLQARRRGTFPLLQGYGAAAVAHQHRRAVRYPLHLRLEPVSVAAADPPATTCRPSSSASRR